MDKYLVLYIYDNKKKNFVRYSKEAIIQLVKVFDRSGVMTLEPRILITREHSVKRGFSIRRSELYL